MEILHQCVALGPIAVYLVALGFINLGRRPRVIGGGRDAAMLGSAISGLVLVGPLSLLFPGTIAARLGPAGTRYIWLILIVLYGLLIALWLLTMRPRLVIYNITATQLRPVLEELAARLDPEAQWAGDSLALPGLGVQSHLETVVWMRNVSLVSSGPKQNYAGWDRLAAELGKALRQVEVTPNPRGMTLLSVGFAMLLGLAWSIATDPHAIVRSFHDLMN